MIATANVDFYLDYFVFLFVQRGLKERRQIIQHMFHKTDRAFRPKEATDTDRKEPIYLKNLGK